MSNDVQAKPRKARDAERTGSYGLAVRLSTTVVDPGETLTLEVYISGYGQIQGSKLVFYPSPAIVARGSSCRFGLGPPDGEGLACFGFQKTDLDPLGNTIVFGVEPLSLGAERPTMYVDARPAGDPHQISTETKSLPTNCAPVQVELVTRSDARPGMYSVQFLFTYFNGSAWANSSETVQFSVRSVYQRYEGWIWRAGAVVTVIAIPLGIGELCSRIGELCSWLAEFFD